VLHDNKLRQKTRIASPDFTQISANQAKLLRQW
jgi:hypothetical protein